MSMAAEGSAAATLLVVNTGSRSVKLTLYGPGAQGNAARWHAELDQPSELDAPEAALAALADGVRYTVQRLVHGGERVPRPAWLTPALAFALPELAALAPLHNPRGLAWLRACRERWPQARHLLVPDTGFFHDLPESARRLPLPDALCARHGLRRYGFHGLAHESLWRALARLRPDLAAGRVLSLQLGGGASAAALLDGRPLATSMGYSPLSGLIMATRPGDLDPGVLLRLLASGEYDAAALERLLHHESGLLALSGRSGDMRALLAADDPGSRAAVAAFVASVRHYLGAYAAVLGGLDAVVFGGGIGAGSARIRCAVLEGFAWLGLNPDAARNAQAGDAACITVPDSPVSAWVFANGEDALLRDIALRALEDLGHD
ncbi:MAG: acetate/propionate family kinase [Gammaproteobacteria bacterium]|nr:acetate/propionate family kinase [Gammaproteobacteria bacterium]